MTTPNHPSGQDKVREIFPYSTDMNMGIMDFRPQAVTDEVTEDPKPKSEPESGSLNSSSPEELTGKLKPPVVITTPTSSSPASEKGTLPTSPEGSVSASAPSVKNVKPTES